jgi:hypothetical protein
LQETAVSESDLKEYLLSSQEIAEVKELLANVAEMLTGRSHPDARRRDEEPLTRANHHAALPMLPQYPCGSEAGIGGPSGAFAVAASNDPRASSNSPPTDAPSPRRNVPPEVTERVIRGADEELRACYDEGLRKDADLGGKVTMRFTINEDGSVGDVRPVCTSLPDPEVVSCMVNRFGQLRFPKPSGGRLTVFYPIMFTPGN